MKCTVLLLLSGCVLIDPARHGTKYMREQWGKHGPCLEYCERTLKTSFDSGMTIAMRSGKDDCTCWDKKVGAKYDY